MRNVWGVAIAALWICAGLARTSADLATFTFDNLTQGNGIYSGKIHARPQSACHEYVVQLQTWPTLAQLGLALASAPGLGAGATLLPAPLAPTLSPAHATLPHPQHPVISSLPRLPPFADAVQISGPCTTRARPTSRCRVGLSPTTSAPTPTWDYALCSRRTGATAST